MEGLLKQWPLRTWNAKNRPLPGGESSRWVNSSQLVHVDKKVKCRWFWGIVTRWVAYFWNGLDMACIHCCLTHIVSMISIDITYILLVYYCKEQAARPFSSVFECGCPSSEVGYVSSLGYNWRWFHHSISPCLDLMSYTVFNLKPGQAAGRHFTSNVVYFFVVAMNIYAHYIWSMFRINH